MAKPTTIRIDDIEYIRADTVSELAVELDGLQYVIVRTFSAGVFAGYLQDRDGKEVTLRNARRLWYWDGAASLSQLAVEGVKSPKNCKFPIEVPSVILTEAVEILDVTKKAQTSIAAVEIWAK